MKNHLLPGALVCLAITSLALAQPAPITPAPAQTFPAFGVQLTPPPGWANAHPALGQIARWTKPGPDDMTLPGTITVEFGSKNDALNLEGFVASVAKGQKLAPAEKSQLDGEPAIHLLSRTTPGTPGTPGTAGSPGSARSAGPAASPNRPAKPGAPLKPPILEAFAAEHHGMYFVIFSQGDGRTDFKPDVHAIRANWKWVPLEPVHDHLALAPAPLSILGGLVRIKLPASARPKGDATQGTQAFFMMADLPAARPTFAIHLTLQFGPANVSLATLADGYAANLAKTVELAEPVKWTATATGGGATGAGATRGGDSRPALCVSQWVKGTAHRRGAEPRLTRYAMAQARPGQVLQVQFILHPGDAESLERYQAASDEMLKSIEFVAPGR